MDSIRSTIIHERRGKRQNKTKRCVALRCVEFLRVRFDQLFMKGRAFIGIGSGIGIVLVLELVLVLVLCWYCVAIGIVRCCNTVIVTIGMWCVVIQFGLGEKKVTKSILPSYLLVTKLNTERGEAQARARLPSVLASS